MIISRCRLVLHDFTYYATREMGRLYETEKYLHNYGLTFALGLAQASYFNSSQVPDYPGHLLPLNELQVYVTPARPLTYDFLFHTFKTASVPYYNFTPQTTVNKVLFGRAKELSPGSAFEFYVISNNAVPLPRWVRLGKWMSKARLEVIEALDLNVRPASPFTSGCVLNPLDVNGHLLTFDLVSMPPVSLIINAQIDGSHYELPDGTKIPSGMKYSFPISAS